MPYTIEREIGRGGMGAVFLGKDEQGQQVAIKMLSNRFTCYPDYRELFESEVKSLKTLSSQYVVKVLGDKFEDPEGNYYVPMEYIRGEDIEHRVRRQGLMDYRDAITMMEEILDAIQDVHNQNIIHRDIKPSNIMIRDNGHICIIDFGIAKDARVGSTGKTVGTIIGTDGYMSPEQATGLNIDKRTDIYSLGCVLYFMLTGRHAVIQGGNSQENLNAILNGSMPRPSSIVPNIPQELDAVYLRAVDKNMLNRYSSAAEFKSELQAILLPRSPQVTVGRGSDNDIYVTNQQVSSQHLTIKGLTDDYGNHKIQIIDHSTNGTSVNGARLHRDSIEINYTDVSALPEVLMAGLDEGEIHWSHVIGMLKSRGWDVDVTSEPGGKTKIKGGSIQIEQKAEVWQLILSFLVPIVGLVFFIIYHDNQKKKSKQVGIAAILGFVLSFIISVITIIIVFDSI